MSNIKPIETEYKGYRFRSRLEARWAVFFDEVRIAWQYEIEGYELSNGVKYLPDFYLPEYQLFVEIKPEIQQREPDWKNQVDAWEMKCDRFRTDAEKAILIVYGDPMTDIWGKLFAWVSDDLVLSETGKIKEYTGYSRFIPFGFAEQPEVVLLTADWEKDQICITPTGKTNKKVTNPIRVVFDYWEDAYHLLTTPMYREFGCEDDYLYGLFDEACKKARQARFEHGQSGAIKQTVPHKQPHRPSDEGIEFINHCMGTQTTTDALKEWNQIVHSISSCTWFEKEYRFLDLFKRYGYTMKGTWEDQDIAEQQREVYNKCLSEEKGWTEYDPVTGVLIA